MKVFDLLRFHAKRLLVYLKGIVLFANNYWTAYSFSW